MRRLASDPEMDAELVQRWLAAWERHARRSGLNSRTLAFWDGAWAWIMERRLQQGDLPTTDKAP